MQVCPTGIDIRNGLQYECIACGACIDACDEVMDKLGYPRGLIRYSTQNAIDGKPTHVLRPRIVVYGALLLVLLAAWAWGVTHRSTLIVEVLRDRNALYRVDSGGTIENAYTLKIVNKTDADARFRVGIEEGPEGAQLLGVDETILAPAGEVLALPLRVAAPAGTQGRHELEFEVEAEADGKTEDRRKQLLRAGPVSGRPAWREPIVWLVAGLPAATVLASIGLILFLAGQGSDDAIPERVQRTSQIQQTDLSPDETAAQRGLRALLRFDDTHVELLPVAGDLDRGAVLTLHLSHPTDSSLDLSVELQPAGAGWRADAQPATGHDWRLSLVAADGQWRLTGRMARGERATLLMPAIATP